MAVFKLQFNSPPNHSSKAILERERGVPAGTNTQPGLCQNVAAGSGDRAASLVLVLSLFGIYQSG